MLSDINQHFQAVVLSGTHHRWPVGQAYSSPPMPCNTLWYVTESFVAVTIQDREFEVGCGEAMLTPSGVWREISTPDGGEWLSIVFQAEIFSHFDVLTALNPPIKWTPNREDAVLMETLMRQIVAVCYGVSSYPKEDASKIIGRRRLSLSVENQLIADCLAGALAGLVLRHHADAGQMPAVLLAQPSWLVKAMDYLRGCPTTTVDEWAQSVAYSPSRFRALFHEAIGSSPREYLQRYRMERAQRLLATTDHTIEQIAFDLGFHSISHFSQMYTAAFGATPAKYRKMVHFDSR